jgi:beta-xylosidase
LVHAWAASRVQVNSLLTVHAMNAAGTEVLDRGRHVFDGHDAHPTVEGPKFYKRNGYYYIFAPAGGVATGWQLVLRSKNVYGPYEEKVVLAQGNTAINGPHQGAWVDTPEGESWFIHFQDVEAYGRIVHLQPVQWVDDWPVIGVDTDGDGVGEPVLRHKKPHHNQGSPVAGLPESDEFSAPELGLQWQWHANPQLVWSALIPGKDHIRLFALPRPEAFINHWTTPNLLLQKFPAPDFTATTKITLETTDVDQSGGLMIMGRNYSTLQLTKVAEGYELVQVICEQADKGKPEQVVAALPLREKTVYLRVQVKGPDARCTFSYSTDGQHFEPVGKIFTAVPGGWIGAKVGLLAGKGSTSARGGYIDVDWFNITP